MGEQLDYAAILAQLQDRAKNLKAQREALNRELSGVETTIAGLQVLVSHARNTETASAPDNAAPQSVAVIGAKTRFRGMEVAAAARIILREDDGLSTREIARRLEAGGYEHNSQNFVNTVYTMLHRQPDFERIENVWTLKPSRQSLSA